MGATSDRFSPEFWQQNGLSAGVAGVLRTRSRSPDAGVAGATPATRSGWPVVSRVERPPAPWRPEADITSLTRWILQTSHVRRSCPMSVRRYTP
jgi:hypothetical protein